jgi:hypothetical protein
VFAVTALLGGRRGRVPLRSIAGSETEGGSA